MSVRSPVTFATLAALALLTACGTSGTAPGSSLSDGGPSDGGTTPTPDAGDGGLLAARPYTLVVPTSYDKSKPTPVVFMLHGYSANGTFEEGYMQLAVAAEAHVFLYAYADGTVDSRGNHFWNATDGCCNFDNKPVDDVGYIDAVLADIAKKYNVDPKRVFLVGHSNGGFMAHRYACERAGTVAAFVALAGDVWADASRCQPSGPVSVAQVHGDLDMEIGYDGGSTTDVTGASHTYPTAHQSVATWATKDQCSPGLLDGGTLTIDTSQPANATQVERYGACAQTSGVELWTMHGSGHIPGLGPSWGEDVWAFLSSHPKP